MTEALTRFIINFDTKSAKVRHETLEGRKYLVVPAVIGVEGVWNGSQGPLFYPQKELAKTPAVWDHKPVVVYHPEMDGKAISACRPEVIESRKVGMMLNTMYDTKLRTETWLDEEKLNKVDPRILKAIEKGEKVEVSSGLFTDNEHGEGEWKGKKYVATAKNYRPDHLALLPDKVGACSIEDGAGLLANQEGNTNMDPKEVLLAIFGNTEPVAVLNRDWSEEKRINTPLDDFGDPENRQFPVETEEDLHNAASLLHHAKNPNNVKKRLKSIAKRKGLKVPNSWQDDPAPTKNEEFAALQELAINRMEAAKPGLLVNNIMSHREMAMAINHAMTSAMPAKSPDGKSLDYWPGYVEDIYDNFFIYSQQGAKGVSMFKANYTLNNKTNTLTIDDPKNHTSVKKHVEYRASDGKTIAPKNQTIQVVMGGAPGNPLPGVQPLANNQGVENVAATTEEFITNAPPEIRAFLQEGLDALNAEKARLVKIISEAKGNILTNEQLAAKPLNDLRCLASLVVANQPNAQQAVRVPLYLGAGTPAPVSNAADEPKMPEPLVMPTANFRPAETNGTAK